MVRGARCGLHSLVRSWWARRESGDASSNHVSPRRPHSHVCIVKRINHACPRTWIIRLYFM